MSEHHYSPESREFLRENLQQFLAAINNCTEEEAMLLPLTWQIFPESPLLRSMDFLDAKILHGTPRKYWPTLLDRNEDGYHIGLCTSRMRPSITGKPRRDKESVESFHYLAVDIDVKDRDQEVHPEAPDYGDALTTFGLGLAPLSPTILVDFRSWLPPLLCAGDPAERRELAFGATCSSGVVATLRGLGGR